MPAKRVAGIDPGVTGALAVLEQTDDGAWKVLAVYDLPVTQERTSTGKVRRHIDPAALYALLESLHPIDRVVVERLVAPPGISGVAAYSLGATAATIGTVLAVLGLGVKLVGAGVWKRALEVPKDKEAARQFASEQFGTSEYWRRKMDHNRAEAALIALYGALL